MADENRQLNKSSLPATRRHFACVPAQSEHTALENELRKAREVFRAGRQESGGERGERRQVTSRSRGGGGARVAARQVAAAEARAAAAEARAVAAETKVEEMKRSRVPRTVVPKPPWTTGKPRRGCRRKQSEQDGDGGGGGGGTRVAPKRRRQKSPEPPPAEPDEEFECQGKRGRMARRRPRRRRRSRMQQLKHQLQVKGLAHLYVGKRGIKKPTSCRCSSTTKERTKERKGKEPIYVVFWVFLDSCMYV